MGKAPGKGGGFDPRLGGFPFVGTRPSGILCESSSPKNPSSIPCDGLRSFTSSSSSISGPSNVSTNKTIEN